MEIISTHKVVNDYVKQYGRGLGNTNESKKQPWQDWKDEQYHDIADDYIHELDLNRYDADDVHWIIDHRSTMFKMDYKDKDIIAHICLVVLGFSISRQRLGGIIKNRLSTIKYNKDLYKLVKDKLTV